MFALLNCLSINSVIWVVWWHERNAAGLCQFNLTIIEWLYLQWSNATAPEHLCLFFQHESKVALSNMTNELSSTFANASQLMDDFSSGLMDEKRLMTKTRPLHRTSLQFGNAGEKNGSSPTTHGAPFLIISLRCHCNTITGKPIYSMTNVFHIWPAIQQQALNKLKVLQQNKTIIKQMHQYSETFSIY